MEAGAKVYYPDPAEAYLVATVKHVAGLGADAELTLVPEKGGELKKVAKEADALKDQGVYQPPEGS